jgi:hypothetical protein
MVRDVGVQPTGFWGLWCQFAVGAVVGGRNGCVVEVVGVVGEGFVYAFMVVGWWVRDLIEWSLVPMLQLTKNIEGVMHLYEPCLLPIDVLPTSFCTLNYSMLSQDGLLFLLEPLNFLLNSS